MCPITYFTNCMLGWRIACPAPSLLPLERAASAAGFGGIFISSRIRMQRAERGGAGVVKQGGEGLMLHRGASHYRAERNDDLLKLKPYQDAEARVVGHLPGKGKYAGMLGALEVETAEGLRFRLGSGLSDAERRAPPPLGCRVTYRYNGINEKTGTPRFARFMRIREDM